MESALEVLSRAATMVNTNSADNRLAINKELPTTKWRRDRRIRLSSEYHHSNHEPVGTVKPLGESNQSNSLNDGNMEIPLDMSVGASKPPPPPYRDPLPGSTFNIMSRPSVITQAPKREIMSNQENKESLKKPIVMCDDSPATESISMVDPVIDEHFRRSLGADYMNLFGKRLDQLKSASSPTTTTTTTIRKSPQTSPVQSEQSVTNARTKETATQPSSDNTCSPKANRDNVKETVENIEMSVDDHFAKALGDTWKQLQQHSKPNSCSTELDHDSDKKSDPDNDSNASNDCSMSPNTDTPANCESSESQSHR